MKNILFILSLFISLASFGQTQDTIIGKGGNKLIPAADLPYLAYPVRGNIFSEAWANTTNWTATGSPTTSVSGGYLSITDGAGGNALSKYLYYSAYSWTDIRPVQISTTVIVGTKSATSYAPTIGLRGTRSMVAMVDLTTGGNAGKINWYYNNITTAYQTSTGSLTISNGDTLDVVFRLDRDQYIFTVTNRATRRSITDWIYISTLFNKPVHVPINYYPVIQAMGSVVHKVGAFTFSSNAPKNATILEVGNSLTYAGCAQNVDNEAMGILARNYKGVFYNYGAPGALVESINTSDIINMAPQVIVLRLGINNLLSAQSATSFMTKMRTATAAYTSGGYTLGVNLFVATLTPYTVATVAVYNDSLIAQYGSAIIDLNKTLAGTTATTFNPAYYVYDGLHYSELANRAIANTYATLFNLTYKPGGTLNSPITTNDKSYLSLGRLNALPYTPLTYSDPIATFTINKDTAWTAGIDIMNTASGVLRLGAGITHDGTQFLSKTANAGLLTMDNSNLSYFQKRGSTPGTVPTFNSSDAKFFINDSGYAVFNGTVTDTYRYSFNIYNNYAATSQLHLGSISTSDSGSYFYSAPTGLTISSGSSIRLGNHVAQAATASALTFSNGGLLFRYGAGLTAGNIFTPTYLGNWTPSGLYVGGSTPATANLHLIAGAATASRAPLKFTTGTNLTTAEAGAMEYNGANLFFSPSTTRYTVDLSLTGSSTLDFGSTAAGGVSDLTLTVTGAADGDVVSLGVPNTSMPVSGSFSAWVSATNTVTVRYANNDLINARDPASGTFKVRVIK